MREKSFLLRHLNARALKSAIFSALASLPGTRAYLNYYQDAESFEDAAEPGSVRAIEIRPVRDYGIVFSDREREAILRRSKSEVETLTLTFKMAQVRDVTILGSAGVSVCNATGKALYLDRTRTRMHRNWVVARPLREIEGDSSVAYVNLLGVRKGHRHFAHFFWDMLVPLMVYLRNWHDPARPVIFLVREDLSDIQRDAFRFLAEDHLGVRFQTLGGGEKIRCANTIYLAYQNPSFGKDNALAREAMSDMRDLFVRHYGIEPPSPGSELRLHVSRRDAALRRLKNEAEIEAVLAQHGFESHEMSKHPFRRQADLFHAADAVVATHGAGLANLMFCRPGTRVLEIFPANFIDEGFLKLAKAMELDYDFLVAGAGDFRQDFRADPAELRRKLGTMERA